MPSKPPPPLGRSAKVIDPALDALFASSSGPLQKPQPPSASNSSSNAHLATRQHRIGEVLSQTSQEPESQIGLLNLHQDGPATPISHDLPAHSSYPIAKQASTMRSLVETNQHLRIRKRKRSHDNPDLEAKYMASLANNNHLEPPNRRRKEPYDGDSSSDNTEQDNPGLLVHQSLAPDPSVPEMERASRTVFLGNVSMEAVSSKQAKKTLINHLVSALDSHEAAPDKLESLRFRSVAFSSPAMPKRAAYITKSLMESTTHSVNAYAVFSTPAAARKVVSELNGSQVLGRHLRADCVAHPSAIDHRRCVFVGNLGFVDDETVINTDSNGETVEKKRNKVPSDIEEGLWRTFGKKGKIENVRVVRDAKTRVGKGIAYVQFYDANHVEAALLLNGSKHPPMLPRRLRVTRTKDPRKTALAQSRSQEKTRTAAAESAVNPRYRPKPSSKDIAAAGRAGKLLGRVGALKQRNRSRFASSHAPASTVIKSPEQIVFEGQRASAINGGSRDGKPTKSKRKSMKPNNKSTRRATEWRRRQTAKQ
ncbi:hypothetical protein CDD82_2113 [Ophiocordyceps australis]|uniref:Nucleolar protein 12 n=1 Tax=Ophiocordyceps australis TaxID=1399860 RepID=A0A2C5YP80_9HYPO|nr:hypothetical protein CDD82_2113 [Ophiocordyceps australis]